MKAVRRVSDLIDVERISQSRVRTALREDVPAVWARCIGERASLRPAQVAAGVAAAIDDAFAVDIERCIRSRWWPANAAAPATFDTPIAWRLSPTLVWARPGFAPLRFCVVAGVTLRRIDGAVPWFAEATRRRLNDGGSWFAQLTLALAETPGSAPGPHFYRRERSVRLATSECIVETFGNRPSAVHAS